MIRILIIKELKHILLGPKFLALFGVCSILIIMSMAIGIADYRSSVRQYEAGNQLAEQERQEQRSWGSFGTRISRKPDPMQILVSGVSNDVGRFSRIRETEPIKLTNSIYTDDSIFAVFRFLDLGFIFDPLL